MSLSATAATRAAHARNRFARRALALGPLLFFSLLASGLGLLVLRASRPTPANELAETVTADVLILTLLQIGTTLTIALPLALAAGYTLTGASRRGLSPWLTGVLHAGAALPSVAVISLALTYVFAGRTIEGSCCVFFDPVPATPLILALVNLPQLVVLSAMVFALTPPASRGTCEALGLSPWRTFRTVVLPAARARLVTAVLLALARTVGAALPVAFLGALWFGDGNPSLAFGLFGEMLRGAEGARHALWIVAITSFLTLLASVLRARWERKA
ncbi:MAG: hypothetical protein AAGA81_03300 [Acidobacteriota bacterium]